MSQETEHNSHGHEAGERAPKQATIKPRSAAIIVILVVVILAVFAAIGIVRRIHASSALAEHTDETAPPTVSVGQPRPGAPIDNFVLPGNVTAYTDSPIYARTDGYLQHWYFDIGARVKKGDLLAVIDTPEIDRQVAQAEADLATAEANAGNAKVQADRYAGLVKSDAVSQQETDTLTTQANATASTVKSAQENLQRLRQLQSFEKIYAPFDGVLTARTVDTGQLIAAGSGTELFHLQALRTLRVYTNVPEAYTPGLKRGMKIPLTFTERPGKSFEGTLVRTADAIDPTNRTLLTEVDVDNRSGELMPGSLAQVHFKTPRTSQTYIVPSSALIFRRDGLQVSTTQQNGGDTVAHLSRVVVGQDDGANVQIVSGIGPNDKVIQDPPDSLIDGEKVTIVKDDSAPPAGGK